MSHLGSLDEFPEHLLQRELRQRADSRRRGRCDYCGRPLEAEPFCRFPSRHTMKPEGRVDESPPESESEKSFRINQDEEKGK